MVSQTLAGESHFIGLISGTSVDGIDAALVTFSDDNNDRARCIVQATHSHHYPPDIKAQILTLFQPGASELDTMGFLDIQLGELFAEAANSVVAKAGLKAKDISGIGSHGQTLRHRPHTPAHQGFSLQIADPNVIAEKTGILTVADFRRRDMAAGGEGAPLAPAVHEALFSSPDEHRIILNIGGIANLTRLKAGLKTTGYDTGPGNALMDSWISLTRNKPYDRGGQWAQSGAVHTPLLDDLRSDSYFSMKAPKSTGKEYFHQQWLNDRLQHFPGLKKPEDIQATLLALSIETISDAITLTHPHEQKGPATVYCCGGGVHNTALMQGLRKAISSIGIQLDTTEALGIAPDWVEAVAFAWLAKQRITQKTGNLTGVTGAAGERILGGVYLP